MSLGQWSPWSWASVGLAPGAPDIEGHSWSQKTAPELELNETPCLWDLTCIGTRVVLQKNIIPAVRDEGMEGW